MGVGIYPPPANDTGWITPTLINSWVVYGSPYTAPAYRKINGRVFLKGLVKNGSVGFSIFILPVGFRPPEYMHLSGLTASRSETTGAASAGTAHTHPIPFDQAGLPIKIQQTGEVLVDAAIATNWVCLDNVNFLAA
ncbi:hypothetical protein KGG70_gp57 [Streptomyces phage Celia]|uniref:Minor tail protein n=1 Tax=Streptomyces phage Celia TaxID=2590946 RepID=A0A516KRA9_9CAUD|nr:hypothetical protein KGG70_gp57 [Streptomyces phage Celia]QDP44227.1 hypothetical protein SEA_CELIA_24 [Streptomyces phage Celia]QFG10487.1 minor tail protein [Streptomyces phage Urza]QJD50589.1 minor tail protein [Streptomyces phage Itza]